MEVGLGFARQVDATHVILTGKADPTQEDLEYLSGLIKKARKYMPFVDIHTNGLILQGKRNTLLYRLKKSGLTMVTFSVASFDPVVNRELMGINQRPEDLIKKASDLELTLRCSLLINKQGVSNFKGIMDYVEKAGDLGVHKIVVREVWVPEVHQRHNQAVYQWNNDNRILIGPIEKKFRTVAKDPRNKYSLREKGKLPWGTTVFTAGGPQGTWKDGHRVEITFARCDEATRGQVIKSIVHTPDGHGYANWDDRGFIFY